jgi:hypothetical protein
LDGDENATNQRQLFGQPVQQLESVAGNPVTASIAADSKLAITGNASVSSVCFNQLALSGTQVGGAGQIVGTDPKGDSVTFLFISKDAAFGSVAGVYSVTAGPTTCAGDSGTGSLTKM